MLKMYYQIVKYYFLWIVVFFLERVFFIGYFHSEIFPISFTELISIFLYGLRMDASMAGYICALPLLFFILRWCVPAIKIPSVFLKVYSLIILTLCAVIMAVNLNIYQEWGTKLPYRVLSTLIDHPYEAYISSTSTPFLIPFSLLLIIILLGWVLIKNILDYRLKFPHIKWYGKAAISIVLT